MKMNLIRRMMMAFKLPSIHSWIMITHLICSYSRSLLRQTPLIIFSISLQTEISTFNIFNLNSNLNPRFLRIIINRFLILLKFRISIIPINRVFWIQIIMNNLNIKSLINKNLKSPFYLKNRFKILPFYK
jgi:hypothetical protein